MATPLTPFTLVWLIGIWIAPRIASLPLTSIAVAGVYAANLADAWGKLV